MLDSHGVACVVQAGAARGPPIVNVDDGWHEQCPHDVRTAVRAVRRDTTPFARRLDAMDALFFIGAVIGCLILLAILAFLFGADSRALMRTNKWW
jgi:hypothetical protein